MGYSLKEFTEVFDEITEEEIVELDVSVPPTTSSIVGYYFLELFSLLYFLEILWV